MLATFFLQMVFSFTEKADTQGADRDSKPQYSEGSKMVVADLSASVMIQNFVPLELW